MPPVRRRLGPGRDARKHKEYKKPRHVQRTHDVHQKLSGSYNLYTGNVGLSYENHSKGSHKSVEGRVSHTSSTGRGTSSSHHAYHHSKSTMKLLQGIKPVELFGSSPSKLVAGDGVQAVATLYSTYDYPTWAAGNNIIQVPYDPRFTAVPNTNTTYRWSMDWAELDMEWSNLCNHQVNFILYECVAKFNHGYSAAAAWTDGLAEQTTTFLNTGGAFSNGSILLTTYKATPRMCEKFTHHWKIEKETHFTMSTGDVHRHKSFFKFPKLMSPADWDEVSGTKFQFKKNVSRQGLLVIRGIPDASSAAPAPNVGISGAQLDIVINAKQSYRARAQDTSKLQYLSTSNLPTAVGQVVEPSQIALTNDTNN